MGARAEQPAHALGKHDDVGVHLVAAAVGAHADHLAAGIFHELRHRGLADDQRARVLHLPGEPFVELGADNGVAVRPLFVEVVGAIMQPDMGAIVHHPEPLLDQMTLQQRVLAEIGDELFEHVGVEDRALHVLRSRIFAALELQHLEAALGHGEGCGIARHAGPDDDRVELLLDHRGHL